MYCIVMCEVSLHRVPEKKLANRCLIITLANVDLFSKFFHQMIRKKIIYVHITKISTSPAICCENRKSKNVNNFDSTSTDYWHVSEDTEDLV